MANITIERKFRTNIYQLDTTDPVLGGGVALDVNGDPVLGTAMANVQAKQIADRTAFMKWRFSAADISKRNSLLACQLGANGKPNYVNFGGGNVDASSLEPFVISFSGGFDEFGPVDFYKFINTNAPITSGVGFAGAANLFAVYDEINDVVAFVDYGVSNLYINSVTVPNPATYKFWYDPRTCIFYESDLVSTWTQVYMMFLGVINWTALTSILNYPGQDNTGVTSPVGTVHAYAGGSAPDGYLLCQGQAISRTDYAELFGKLGTSFGAGNGTTTFNIPDLRGRWIRGFDAGAGVDAGRVFGSYQADQEGAHAHLGSPDTDLPSYLMENPVAGPYNVKVDHAPGTGIITVSASPTTADGGSPGYSDENIVKNIAMNYIIKF